jgi:hypothetical protein
MADFRIKLDQSLTINISLNNGSPNADITYRMADNLGIASITSAGVFTPIKAGLAVVEAIHQTKVIRRFTVQVLSAGEVAALEQNNLTVEIVGSGSSIPLPPRNVDVE